MEVVAILAATEAEAMEVKEMGTITTEVMMETGVEVSGENVGKEEDIREEVAVVEGDKEVA